MRYHAFAIVVLALLAFDSRLQAAESTVSGAERILSSQSRLAAALIGKLDGQAPSGRVVVSPASVAGMLTALVSGADETAVAAMGKTLQIDPGPTLSGDVDVLRDTMARGGASEVLTSATRLVFAPSAPPTGDAQRRLAGAGVEATVADLASTRAIDDLNAWVGHVTHGKIDKVLDAPSPDLSFVALNALYFKADWETPFEEGGTSPREFRMVGGGRIRADMMHGLPSAFAFRDEGRFVAVDMPFKGRRYSMVILTTKDEPAAIGQFRAYSDWLTGRGFRHGPSLIVDMPRLKLQSSANLLPALRTLGLDENQRFPNLTAGPMSLSAVKQTVTMDLDENGAEVAAVTGGFAFRAGIEYAGVSKIVIDKPFAFALRDARTGLILVAGFVAAVDGQPVAANAPSPVSQSRLRLEDDEIAQDQWWNTMDKMRAMISPRPLPPSRPALRIEGDF